MAGYLSTSYASEYLEIFYAPNFTDDVYTASHPHQRHFGFSLRCLAIE